MLTFNLKKQWFDKIKSGEITHEYVNVGDFEIEKLSSLYTEIQLKFDKRFHAPKNADICFKLGFPKSTQKDYHLFGKIKSINIINGKNTDLAIDKDVYDIEFELMGDKENVCKD